MVTIACYIRDDKLTTAIQKALSTAKMDHESFLSETALLRTLRRRSFDLILIDTGFDIGPEEHIFSWLNCRTCRSTPVIVLSSSRSAHRIAHALDAGADDFITTPLDPVELVARLHAIIRRYHRQPETKIIELAGYRLDQNTGRLTDRGLPIPLTPREFMMTWLLFSSFGQYLSRETISVAVWGVDCEVAHRTIEQHIYKVRKKLGLCENRGINIRTAYSHGYRLEFSTITTIG